MTRPRTAARLLVDLPAGSTAHPGHRDGGVPVLVVEAGPVEVRLSPPGPAVTSEDGDTADRLAHAVLAWRAAVRDQLRAAATRADRP